MTTKKIAGLDVQVNDEGFMTNPAEWTKEIALELAKEEGIELTDAQEQIDYINSVLGIQQQQASEDRALAQEAAITEQVIAEQQAARPAPRPNNNGSKQ